MSLYQIIRQWIKSLFISTSIIKTIKTSHVVIITLLLIPLLLGIVIIFFNTLSYSRLITNVDNTNRLAQIIRTEITGELWDIVAGNKPFNLGSQYSIIEYINSEFEDIMRTTRETESRQILEVAGRAMQTLLRYVDRLGNQIENRFPVIENERTLDEIRGVASLVSELLQDFIVREIESAARENRRIITRAMYLGISEAVIIVIALLFSFRMRTSVAKSIDYSINSLVGLSSSIAEGNLDARVELTSVSELKTLANDLNIMADKIKTLIAENIREQHNLQKSEMKALQAQIQPHFLYNTLDSIVWLAESNNSEQVISITKSFSDFFRISLNKGIEWLYVKDELKHIESYLTIQKIRYRDILDYSIEYDPKMERSIMLKLLLQPLVENALYHGVKNKRGKGMIEVKGWQENNFLYFSITDDGAGMTAEKLLSVKHQLSKNPLSATPETKNRIYGLYNVAKRLELYYGDTSILEIKSNYREGTQVMLKIPETAGV
jgi:two-component system sensor histidine kinase YesM